jgi:hypothetical protein
MLVKAVFECYGDEVFLEHSVGTFLEAHKDNSPGLMNRKVKIVTIKNDYCIIVYLKAEGGEN